MAKIFKDRVAFEGLWGGKHDTKGGNRIVYKIEVPVVEQAASIVVQSWAGCELIVKFQIGGKKIELGECKYEGVRGSRGGESVLFFLTTLKDWLPTKEEQMLFDENVIVVGVFNKTLIEKQ